MSVIFIAIVGSFVMSASKNSPVAQSFTPVQGYVSCSDKTDTITTYAVYIGRAVACGQDIGRPMEYVGAWMDQCFDSSERATQLGIFEAGTRTHATNQKNGNSPDSCEQVIKSFKKVTWPGISIKQNVEAPKPIQDIAPPPSSTERTPLPIQTDTIPYIDKLGDCMKNCQKLPNDKSESCKEKCESSYK
jgi:hypothetical protein